MAVSLKRNRFDFRDCRMKNRLKNRLESRGGVSRAVVVLIVLVVIMVIAVIIVPTVIYYRTESKKIGCAAALDTAQRQLDDAYLFAAGKMTKEDAKETVTRVMNGWDDLCPGGGEIYIVESDTDEIGMSGRKYTLVCGIHGSDAKELTRLNSDNAMKKLRDAIRREQINGTQYPESITLTLNGEEITAFLTEKDMDFKRGTKATPGAKTGIVIYYAIVGNGDLGNSSDLPDGSVCYFCYADEEHCANWKNTSGWYGDCFAN